MISDRPLIRPLLTRIAWVSVLIALAQAVFMAINNPLLSTHSFSCPISAQCYINNLAFIGTYLLLNALLVGFIAWLCYYLCIAFGQTDKHSSLRIAMLLTCFIQLIIVLANQMLFPHSVHAQLTNSLIPNTLNHFLLPICLISVGFLIAVALVFYTAGHPFQTTTLLATLLLSVTWHLKADQVVLRSHTEPNVIIIGLDSLRPDRITQQNMPALTQFLKHSVVFSDTITPIARTFPAWISILTGLYPNAHGALEDLSNPEHILRNQTIAHTLQQRGYQTLYATDDTRFNNLDRSYGFDDIVGPKMGLGNIVASNFNDLPLSNLMSLTPFSNWLFPYSTLNREAYITYQPNKFITAIDKALARKDKRPLFLAVHLCMIHWPFLWSNDRLNLQYPKNTTALYRATQKEADQQFSRLMAHLKRRGLLNNTLLIVLSDHGESLNFPHDRLLARAQYIGKQTPLSFPFRVNQHIFADRAKGHGTDVMSPSQYQSLLAFHIFGKTVPQPARFNFPVSLIDIVPTITTFLNFPETQHAGISLMPWILKKQIYPPSARKLHTETGFNPITLDLHKTLNVSDLFELAHQMYRIDPNTCRMVIKDDFLANVIEQQKERAIVLGDWILGRYPLGSKKRYILANRKTGQWTDDLNNAFASQTPIKILKEELL